MKNRFLLLLLTSIWRCYTFAQDTIFSEPSYNGTIHFFTNNKVGLLDTSKAILIPPIYTSMSTESYNLLKVVSNNKVGFINLQNKLVIPFDYERDTNQFIGARISKQILEDESVVIYVGVDENYINFSEGLCAVIKMNKYGFIDTLGKIIIPFQFDGADNFYNGIAIVKMNKKYGAINSKGELIIPYIYDLLVVDEWEQLYAEKDGTSFYIDLKGKNKK